MSKTLLVALREFVENLRTKTFWIGILSFPVLIVAAAFIGRLLEQSKDVRTYAVYDKSEDQWLSQAIFQEASQSDLSKLLEAARDQGGEEQEEARDKVMKWLESLPEDHPMRDLQRRVEAAGLSFGSPEDAEDPDKRAQIQKICLLYTSPSPRDRQKSRMPSSA